MPNRLLAQWLECWLESGAIYRLPSGELLLATNGASDTEARIYAPDFFLADPNPWHVFSSTKTFQTEELASLLNEFTRESTYSWKSADQTLFERDFAELQAEFRAGRLQKAVPITFQTAPSKVEAGDRARWVVSALQYALSRPVTIYGLWKGSTGILGATPETLFQFTSHSLKTMALAGTRRNGEQQLSLLDDPKERREHQLVIDWIQGQLAPFGQVSTGQTRVQDLGALSHLKTEIELASTKPLDFARMVEVLHPTPALGGAPRESARAWLKRCDDRNPIKRLRFGAPFGVSYGEQSSAVVAIRNLQWNERELILGAGCGVIAESDVAKEWAELQGKIAAVKTIFGENSK